MTDKPDDIWDEIRTILVATTNLPQVRRDAVCQAMVLYASISNPSPGLTNATREYILSVIHEPEDTLT